MRDRAVRLPIRLATASSRNGSQWICRRCLATEATSSQGTRMPPPSLPQKKPAEEASNYDPTLPTTQRDYRLTTTDFYLKKALPHKIPPQYLHHSTSELLHPTEQPAREQAQKTIVYKDLRGVVVSSGKMDKTVKVRVPGQTWNKKIHKFYKSYTSHLVHDPNNSLVTGDVVQLHRLRVSSTVRYVVAQIISPFGKPIDERPPVPSADERLAAYKQHRFAKIHRRSLRRKAAMGDSGAIRELRDMGLDPGKGVEAGKGETANLQKGVGKKRTPTDGTMLGAKGQKLPEGVLPSGKHEVGKINDRAQANKQKAMKRQKKAEKNLAEARAMDEALREEELESDSVVGGRQGPFERREGVKETTDGRNG